MHFFVLPAGVNKSWLQQDKKFDWMFTERRVMYFVYKMLEWKFWQRRFNFE